MKTKLLLLLLIVFSASAETIHTISPDNNIMISFRLNEEGYAQYMAAYNGAAFMKWSGLGLNFKDGGLLSGNMRVVSVNRRTMDETYSIIGGKSKYGRDYCNETKILLEEKSGAGRKMELYFRAYNDGAAFRYGIPEQASISNFILSTEETQFNFAGDYNCWAMKKDRFRHSYEGVYFDYKISNLYSKPGIFLKDYRYITLPVTVVVNPNLYLSVTEAAITGYAGMYLGKGSSELGLKSVLSTDTVHRDISVRGKTPAVTPWRVFIIGEKPGVLIESNIITSLNEPSKIPDVSWIKPGRSTWSWWAEDRGFAPEFGYQILGSNTVKYYIDYAERNSIEYVILDGGWYGWFDATRDDAVHDITKTLPELDLPMVASYAGSKGVGLILWVVWYELERQFEEALDYYQSLGIKGIKMDFMDRDDQYMINFYHKVAEACAKRKMIVMYHGSYKPDGLSRTYPNILTYEAVLGNEYNRWEHGLPDPNHNVTVAFTRLVAGSMDYTPGSMTNVTAENHVARWKHPMTRGTRAQQMAMLVIYQSGILTLCESPKIYEPLPEFNFIKQVPAAWDSTIVLDSEMDKYIVIARKKGNDWFIGAITNWNSRDVNIHLSFLEEGEYECGIYSDAGDADTNPQNVKITNSTVNNRMNASFRMAKGGGVAIILKKK